MPSSNKGAKRLVKSRNTRSMNSLQKVNIGRNRRIGGAQYDDSGWNK